MGTISARFARVSGALAIGAAVFALAGCSLVGNTPIDVNPEDGVDTDAFSIVVGDCLNDEGVGEVETVPKIDCAKTHQSEVFASATIPDGDFPDQDTITDQANADCTAEFANYVGIDASESKYSIGYYFPTEESWADGDREILCYLFDEKGLILGSAEGTAE